MTFEHSGEEVGTLGVYAETRAQHGSTATAPWPGLSQFMQPGSSDLNGGLLALAVYLASMPHRMDHWRPGGMVSRKSSNMAEKQE